MQKTSQRPALLAVAILFTIVLGSVYGLAGFSPNLVSSQADQSQCPLSVSTNGNMQYVENCYYKVGINLSNGGVTYVAILDGSNSQSITTQNGILAEELDIGYGGVGHFTGANVSVDTTNAPDNIEVGISGVILQGSSTILSGIVNMTFFADEPYFISSLSSTILQIGTHNSHDVANYVNNSWANTWVGPGNKGETEVCTASPAKCTNYAAPENTLDTNPEIKSLIQSDGPTWGWIGTSPSNASGTEGVGFLLLSFNSTSPNEAAITHYEIKGADVGDWEIEGTGVDPADHSSNNLDPHALQYTSSVPQSWYAAILVYLNAAPWSTFYNFINGNPPMWRGSVVGSYLGSSAPYAAFAEDNRSPNLNDQDWYITNLATTASAPLLTYQDAMFYFMGRNNSLSNNFPLKMFLADDGSTNLDWNFGTPTPTLLTSDGTNAQLQLLYNDPTDGLQLSIAFSTKSNTDKINVTGNLVVTGSSLSAQTISLEANVYQNNLDGNGNPSQYLNVSNSKSTSNLYWNYNTVGISILLPSNNGFTGGVSSNQNFGYLNFVNASSAQNFPSGTAFPFKFAVSFYDPVSNYSPGYSEKIYVPTVKLFTQPFGNASQVGFTEDISRIFSDLLSATEFDSNSTIASMQFIKPFSGILEVYYTGSNASLVYMRLGNGAAESALPFYDSATHVFNLVAASPISSAVLYLNSSAVTTTTTTTSTTNQTTFSSSTSYTGTSFTSTSSSTTTTTTNSTSLGTSPFDLPLSTELIIVAVVVAVVIVTASMISVNSKRHK